MCDLTCQKRLHERYAGTVTGHCRQRQGSAHRYVDVDDTWSVRRSSSTTYRFSATACLHIPIKSFLYERLVAYTRLA